MQYQFSFKHMESSPALQEYAEQKIDEKVRKFVTKPIEAHVTFSVEKHQHTAHCSFRAGDGFQVEVAHTCSDMYGSVDHMVAKFETQLKKQKEKLKDHKQKHPAKMIEAEAVSSDEDAVDAEEVLRQEEARKRASNS